MSALTGLLDGRYRLFSELAVESAGLADTVGNLASKPE